MRENCNYKLVIVDEHIGEQKADYRYCHDAKAEAGKAFHEESVVSVLVASRNGTVELYMNKKRSRLVWVV